ncbi:hypothetical protein [Aureliella helgolandensis]|uniref:Uncharacterized protein n=1 Tax=Aureliella helgolandensis TaxID=2527968 RepID=A0A518GAZ7_9BACT|nr:hypothetical protein [Aureliella helgolandensis]QDV25786.1 hypothetical protein Q31a_41130 [Aureliella helgolandensis]
MTVYPRHSEELDAVTRCLRDFKMDYAIGPPAVKAFGAVHDTFANVPFEKIGNFTLDDLATRGQ